MVLSNQELLGRVRGALKQSGAIGSNQEHLEAIRSVEGDQEHLEGVRSNCKHSGSQERLEVFMSTWKQSGELESDPESNEVILSA